ncbi:hypothetical protein OG871_04270 [Kitasatospora sp. NBC_00374]|uniref:hypothetical protein n=1 Tax=Kitasatospora sp. NBC_00374 TaxID=2975964 RepID=UPI0030E04492
MRRADTLGARRGQTGRRLDQVATGIGRLRRERHRLTVRAIARRADVSATFRYDNAEQFQRR